MPESGHKSREVSPSRRQVGLPAANSSVRGRAGRPGLLEPYHDIAATFFSVGSGANQDTLFLTAARDGDYEKIDTFLRRRNESLINIDVRDRVTGNTPLIWAAKRGHGKIVQLLLRHGADITLRNYEGQTAVEVASPAIRTQLLESVDKGGPHRNLLQAAWQGNAKLVQKILAESRVDINCRNADGLTALLLVTRDVQLFEKLGKRVARGYDPNQVVSDLLANRADPNAEDEEGRTPLHYVSSSKAAPSGQIIRMLINDGSDIESRDRRCFTPIHCASQSGNVDVVVALLDGGSDANARGYAGTTPLHISAINGHDAVVSKLLERGADVTSVDDSGLTPVDVAKTKKVKASLKQAWSEATQGRAKDNLGPVRCPSTSSRRSFDGTIPVSGTKSPKKGGQVIFDTLPSTSSSSLDALTPRRAAVSMLQRQLTHAEKARRAEEQIKREITSAATCARGRTASTTPRYVTGRRLSPLRNPSPHKTGLREIKGTVGTRSQDNRAGSAGTRRGVASSTPVSGARDSQVPLTILGLDLDDNLHQVRVKRIAKGPVGQLLSKKGQFCRSFSSESAAEQDDLYLKAMSSGKASMTTLNDDWEDVSILSTSPPRLTPLRTPSATSDRRLQTISEVSGSQRAPYILDLDQMQLGQPQQSPAFGEGVTYQHPYSNLLLPPTPVYMTNGEYLYPQQDVHVTDLQHYDLSASSKETSPRSDEDIEGEEKNVAEEDRKKGSQCGEVQLAVTNVQDLVRSKSVLNQGNFNIETTRVRHSDDSGCPEEISGSNRSSFTSSSNSSPDSDQHGKQEHSRPGDKKTISPSGVRKRQQDNSGTMKEAVPEAKTVGAKQVETKSGTPNKTSRNGTTKLQQVARDNAAQQNKTRNLQPTQQVSQQVPRPFQSQPQNPSQGKKNSPLKNQVTVHSPALKETMTTVDSSQDINSHDASTSSNLNTCISETSQAVVPGLGTKSAAEPAKVQVKVTVQHTARSSTSSRPNHEAQTVKQAAPASGVQILHKTTQENSPNTSSPQNSSKASATQSQTNTRQTLVDKKAMPNNFPGDHQREPSPGHPPSTEPSMKDSESSGSRIPPPRPAAPPRSRTPSASSLSSTGSSTKDAPQRPPPPNKGKSPLSKSTSSPGSSPTSNKSGGPLSRTNSTPSPHTKGIKSKTVSETTTFRLSTYLAQKEAMVGKAESEIGKNEKPFHKEGRSTEFATSEAVAAGQPQKTPAIILTSQSQTHFHLTEAQEPKNIDENPKDRRTEEVVTEKPQVKQIQVKEHMSPVNSAALAKEKGESPGWKSHPTKFVEATSLDAKPNQPEYSGPVIWDPFEALRAQQKPPENDNEEKSGNSRTKSARTKTQTKKKTIDRQWSVTRGTTGSTSKTKDGKQANKKGARSRSPRPKSPRSKSPKRVKIKKGKKKGKKEDQVEVLLSEKSDLSNVAFIGGLGWQIATECNEQDDVKPIRFRPPIYHSSDDDDPTPRPKVLPNYLDDDPTLTKLLLSDRREKGQMPQLLQLPGQLNFGMSDTTDSESDMDDVEEMVDEVVFPLSTSNDDITPRVVNGTLVSHPDSFIPSPKAVLHTSTDRVSGEEDDIVPEQGEVVKQSRSSSSKHEDLGEAIEESGLPDQPEDELSDGEPPPLLPYDKKGMMNVASSHNSAKSAGKTGKSPKATAVVSPKVSPSTSTKATPKATPSTTPKTTPGGSPVKTKGSSSTSPPQAPPRRQKAGIKGQPVKKTLDGTTSEASKTVEKGKSNTPNNAADKGSQVTKAEDAQSQNKGKTAVSGDESKGEIPAGPGPPPQVPKRRSFKEKQEKKKVVERDKSHAAKSDNPDEDPEIIAMIDEILKSTPHPSMSLSLKSTKSSSGDPDPPRSEEELLRMSINARNKLEAELQNSQNGRMFCEVPVQQPDGTMAPREKMDKERSHEQGPLSPQEQEELKKIVNSLRKMELTVGSDQTLDFHQDAKLKTQAKNQDSQDSAPTSSSRDKSGTLDHSSTKKPPIPPNATSSSGKPSQESSPPMAMDKSPRFIRKLNSWKDDNQKYAVPPGDSAKEPKDSDTLTDLSLVHSEINSDTLSVASGFTDRDDSMVPTDGRMLTSRLGRPSSVCRAASAASNIDSSSDEHIQTIQWKRGNMLGKGAYGKVWCGLTNGGELIAVKQIELNINDMEKAEVEYEKIQEEVELLKTLKHRNIVGYLGTSLEDNMVSIFMQFVPGGSIANLLARFGALEEEVFCHYTKQILEGVEYLHANNVIHRDIKGGNIMLMHNGIIKLIDFGCAKRLCLNVNALNSSNSNLLKSMRGTPYWMAPEVVKETGYGTKSDIWSIGCTVFEMATRKPPWADVPPLAAIFAIGADRGIPELPGKFSGTARDFVSQCMTRDQNLRPTATELLTHSFIVNKKRK